MPNKMIVSCEQFDILHLTRLKFLAQNDFHILCCGKIFSTAGQTSQSYLVKAPNMAQKRSVVIVHNVKYVCHERHIICHFYISVE